MLSIGSTVDALFDGAWYTGTIEDYVNGEYSIRTDVWRQKKWFKLPEIREAGNKLPGKGESTMASKTSTETPKPVVSKVTDNGNEGTQLVTVATDKLYKVRLGQLITIGQTTIEDAKDAERPLDNSNLNSLLTADPKDIPPIEVQRVVVKGRACWLIVDGKHRRARLVALAEEKYRTSIGKASTDDDTGKYIQLLDTSEQTALQKLIDDTYTFASAVNARSENELMTWVYSANNKHGLPTSQRGRAKFALWLIKIGTISKKTGKVLSRREAAKMAGTTHVAINHFLLAKKRASEIVDPDTGKPVQKTPEQLEQEARTQSDKDCRLLASSIKKVWNDVQDDEEQDTVEYILDFFKANEVDVLDGMLKLLSKVSQLLASMHEEEDETSEDEIEDDAELGDM